MLPGSDDGKNMMTTVKKEKNRPLIGHSYQNSPTYSLTRIEINFERL
jgi:hypothetical protein